MFKLLIECSKDISELSINFTDGTSVVTSAESSAESPNITRSESKESKESQRTQFKQFKQFKQAKEELLDLDTEFGLGQANVVQKPDIRETSRAPRVAHELQNLDI